MKILVAMLLSVIMLSSGFMINSPATAAPNENANDNAKRTFSLPDDAIQIAPGVFYLGSSIHDGKVVQGIAIFHHRAGHDGGPGGGGNGGGEKCFTVISKGAKWKGDTPESYLVDPTNTSGLNTDDVEAKIAAAVVAWNAHTPDILGSEVSGSVDGVDEISPDGKNEVLFGDIAKENVIAVNVLWGIFFGPPQGRELVEWDQMYDDIDFDWSLTGEAGKMDLQNIAAHEVGHAVGLSHPSDTCTEETMYAFASLGETKKRDLNPGDIAGILSLYS